MHKLVALFAILLSLGGCVVQSPPAQIRFVTEIDVSVIQGGNTFRRKLIDDDDMHSVLNYLRMLDPYTAADLEADTFRTDRYEITVGYSDGSHTVYRQLYDEYLQVNDGAWKKIDPVLGSRLRTILSGLLV